MSGTAIRDAVKFRGVKWVEDRFTIANAFNYFHVMDDDDLEKTETQSCPINAERFVRSISFLLDYLSMNGNEPVSGSAAHGLAAALKYLADTGFPEAKNQRRRNVNERAGEQEHAK